jgi:hypothetical protein
MVLAARSAAAAFDAARVFVWIAGHGVSPPRRYHVVPSNLARLFVFSACKAAKFGVEGKFGKILVVGDDFWGERTATNYTNSMGEEGRATNWMKFTKDGRGTMLAGQAHGA